MVVVGETSEVQMTQKKMVGWVGVVLWMEIRWLDDVYVYVLG